MTSAAKSSFGTLLKRGDGATPEVFTTIAEVKDIKGVALALATEEVTNHDSPDGFDEFVPTTASGGEVSFTLNFLQGNAGQAALETALINKTINHYRIVYPDTTGKEFSAIVTAFARTGAVKGALTAECTLKVTGKPTAL